MAGTWTYDPAQLVGTSAAVLRNQVRTLVMDVNVSDQQLWDEQITFCLAEQGGNIYLAGAAACKLLAAKYSRDVDTTQGELHRLYSARQKAYAERATELQSIGERRAGGMPYAGGISVSDKTTQNANSDRVQPAFLRGLTDNWLPVAPVDNQSGNLSGAPWW